MAVRKKSKKKVKKSVKRKSPKKSTKKKTKSQKKKKTRSKKVSGPRIPAKQIVGTITHYFPHVQAAVIKLKKPLSVGDVICIKGKTSDFKQKVESIQIDHVPIQNAKKGDEIGLRVRERVREHDLVLYPN